MQSSSLQHWTQNPPPQSFSRSESQTQILPWEWLHVFVGWQWLSMQHSRQVSSQNCSGATWGVLAGQTHCPLGWHSRPPVQAGTQAPLSRTQAPLTQDWPAPQLPLPQTPPQPSAPQVLPAQSAEH